MPEPQIHHQYLEYVTAENLISAAAADRASKVIVTNSEGFVPPKLIPPFSVVSGISVNNSQTLLTANVNFTTSGDTIYISNSGNSIILSTAVVSSINNIRSYVGLVADNNLRVYTDFSGNRIVFSDDLINPDTTFQETASYQVSGSRVYSVTKADQLVQNNTIVQTTPRKTIYFAYDNVDRLVKERVVMADGRTIVKYVTYPSASDISKNPSLLPYMPLKYTKVMYPVDPGP